MRPRWAFCARGTSAAYYTIYLRDYWPLYHQCQLLLAVVAQIVLVWGVFETHWEDAYNTLWFHVHFALGVLEFTLMRVSAPCHRDARGQYPGHHVSLAQLITYEVMAWWALEADALLFGVSLRTLLHHTSDTEFKWRVAIASVSLALTLQRLYVIGWRSTVSAVPTTASPNTGLPCHVSSDGWSELPADPTAGVRHTLPTAREGYHTAPPGLLWTMDGLSDEEADGGSGTEEAASTFSETVPLLATPRSRPARSFQERREMQQTAGRIAQRMKMQLRSGRRM